MRRSPALVSIIILNCFLLPALADPPAPPAGKMWAKVDAQTDEFNGSSLDQAKWLNYHPYWTGRGSTFNKDNVSVANGNLMLKSTIQNEAQQTVYAACVTSKNSNCTFGYYEARLKASKLSMTSSFWFQGKYSEIDVIENIGACVADASRDYLMRMNTHYFVNGWDNDIKTPKDWKMPTRSSDTFHLYGVWWRDANSVWLYHNNVKVAEMTPGGAFAETQYLFFDTEIFDWDGKPTMASLKDPAKNTMHVDWVRAWKLVNGTSIKSSPYPGGIPFSDRGTLKICDIRGRLVATSASGLGKRSLPKGVYLYRFSTGAVTVIQTKVKL